MTLLFTAHTKVKVIHAEEQQKNVGPLVIEKNITFTASTIEELFSAICQDGIRFKALYVGHYKFIQHLIIPIENIKVERINFNQIKVLIKPSTSPSFEVTVYHPSEIINNSTVFDNSVIRTLIRNHQTSFQAQINNYFNIDESYLDALDAFTNIFNVIHA